MESTENLQTPEDFINWLKKTYNTDPPLSQTIQKSQDDLLDKTNGEFMEWVKNKVQRNFVVRFKVVTMARRFKNKVLESGYPKQLVECYEKNGWTVRVKPL